MRTVTIACHVDKHHRLKFVLDVRIYFAIVFKLEQFCQHKYTNMQHIQLLYCITHNTHIYLFRDRHDCHIDNYKRLKLVFRRAYLFRICVQVGLVMFCQYKYASIQHLYTYVFILRNWTASASSCLSIKNFICHAKTPMVYSNGGI